MAASTLTMTSPGNIYVDKPWLLMRWDGVNQHVHEEWRAFANSAEMREGLLQGIQAIKDNRAVSYVNDARMLKVIVHEDQRWIKETWMPLAIAEGLKRIAFVTAATGLGKMTVEDLVPMGNDQGLQSRTFASMTAARTWVSEAQAILW
jgi:hypothetical protein